MSKSYSTDESFVRMIISDFELTDAMRRHMNGPWRVWTVALARLNNYGHAPFRPGELAEKVCGKDTPSNRDRVRDWLKALAAMGWIKPLGRGGSTQLCLMIHSEVANRGAGKATDYVCWEPSHADIRKHAWPSFEVPEVTESDCQDTANQVVTPEIRDPWAHDSSEPPHDSDVAPW
jgi:hypothetical protein